MTGYGESVDKLDEKTINISRALKSLREEIEAIDWYNQRVAASSDTALKAIMAHNRDEEIEHAVMALEWLRRNMDKWDEELRTYLFTEGDITNLEEVGAVAAVDKDMNESNLSIGDLK